MRRGGGVAQSSLTLAPPAVRVGLNSTLKERLEIECSLKVPPTPDAVPGQPGLVPVPAQRHIARIQLFRSFYGPSLPQKCCP